MLKLKNVSKYYASNGVITTGFNKVNLDLHLGEFVVITGESGSGKSTLLNVLSGLDTYEDGEMYINGEETSHYSEDNYLEYRRKYVSNIFQNFNLINSYTVFENISLAIIMQGNSKKVAKKITNELIIKVGMKKYRNTLVSKLSGGQKQKVAIARALANDTPIIVADEPTGNLDSKSSKEVIKLLANIADDKLIIVVTHNKSDFEDYATRLIRMHDGKIAEDVKKNKINLDEKLTDKDVSSISFLNQLILGIKNSFNIPIKFMLMFIIFLLMGTALISNYGFFKLSELQSNENNYNNYFRVTDNNRIIIKKNDGSYFTDNDYNKISKLSNVNKIVKEDILMDFELDLFTDELVLFGRLGMDEITKVDVGRKIQNGNEVIIESHKDNFYLQERMDDIFKEEFTIDTYDGKVFPYDIKVVGVIHNNELSAYSENVIIHLSEDLLNKVMSSVMERYNEITYVINNNYLKSYEIFYNGFMVSDKVLKGQVIVSDNLQPYCKNNYCKNNTLNIKTNNIYNSKELALTIQDCFTNYNAKRIINIDYEEANGYIFLNREDYDKLFLDNNYQSSVFVKDQMYILETEKALKDMGYSTFKFQDTINDYTVETLQIIKIFKVIVTVVLIVTLFLISYFIIKIIYKSRNGYFTTLRTLGSTKRVCTRILRYELITIATLAYVMIILLIYLVQKNVITLSFMFELTKYLGVFEYIVIYLILILLSLLISNRYGRKIFKDSIITTYGERI